MTTLQTILIQFRADAQSNRDLGDRFEGLMQQFFTVDPLYAKFFSDVWMWNEWPDKGNTGDIGIDLVARHRLPPYAPLLHSAVRCQQPLRVRRYYQDVNDNSGYKHAHN